ncbi:hypothetical protein [Paenibacillus sp. WLX2291]|uniref:hypothetical protein n=1 Tax=Paenibacillus sp. WLX2291 TaxID=3296934 RepID=UPI0039844092
MIFIMCLSAGSSSFRTTATINAQTYALTSTTDRNQQSTLKIQQSETASGAEVRQSIHMIHDIGVDIEVDGIRYSKELEPDDVDVSGIDLNRDYAPIYVRDTSGNLVLLQYH